MTQIQLSDTQAVLLSAACARDDAMVFPITAKLKGGAVGNVCKSLLKNGLIEEVAATDLNTVWRHDEGRGPITLRATPLAFTTLGITEDQSGTIPSESANAPAQRREGTKQPASAARAGDVRERAVGTYVFTIHTDINHTGRPSPRRARSCPSLPSEDRLAP